MNARIPSTIFARYVKNTESQIVGSHNCIYCLIDVCFHWLQLQSKLQWTRCTVRLNRFSSLGQLLLWFITYPPKPNENFSFIICQLAWHGGKLFPTAQWKTICDNFCFLLIVELHVRKPRSWSAGRDGKRTDSIHRKIKINFIQRIARKEEKQNSHSTHTHGANDGWECFWHWFTVCKDYKFTTRYRFICSLPKAIRVHAHISHNNHSMMFEAYTVHVHMDYLLLLLLRLLLLFRI